MKRSFAPMELCGVPGRYPVFIKEFRESVSRTQVIPRHWHTNIEMTYRIRYDGKLFIEGEKYDLCDDSLFIINSREVHEIHKYPCDELSAILVSIPYDYIKAQVPEADLYSFRVGDHEKEMKSLIVEMKDTLEARGKFFPLKINSLAMALLYCMMEDAVLRNKELPDIEDSKGKKMQRDITAYLNEHITEIQSTDDLSNGLGYSREHMSRMIRRYFGTTAKELIDQTRNTYAIRLMKAGMGSLEEVAETAGYSGSRNFRDLFKRYYGVHPKEFLKK